MLLPGPHRPNLASRVLGLSLRRVSRDMRALHGHPVLVAETFVDPSRFAGTCYRASNWLGLGRTRGDRRQSGGSPRWHPHGQPKEIFVYPLQPDACQQLSRLDDAPDWSSQDDSKPLGEDRLRSLFEYLRTVQEFRKPRGMRYPLATLLAMAVAARLIGYRCHGQEWSFSPELEGMIPLADSIEMFESASLFSSGDGLGWSKVSDIAAEDNDETDFDFSPDGRILAVSRKGASSKLHPGARPGSRHAIAYLGHPPYRSWRRLPLDRMIQAPAVRWARDRWMVAGRYIDGETERAHPHHPDFPHKGHRYGTRLWTLDDRTGALTQAVTLPSWGDCSYPGMIEESNGDLLVVYYSHSITTDGHQYMGGGLWPGKMPPCSIYLARVVREEMG